jgi:hypothetical protein
MEENTKCLKLCEKLALQLILLIIQGQCKGTEVDRSKQGSGFPYLELTK